VNFDDDSENSVSALQCKACIWFGVVQIVLGHVFHLFFRSFSLFQLTVHDILGKRELFNNELSNFIFLKKIDRLRSGSCASQVSSYAKL
jgi:hypothetical protein